ncbi:restriction endonuclease subunit S [Streptococcus suis]|uniref:restriction endonuclease subunit S n=1 Tax=Streptococcus suis TaxID=1307 RepID=UPI0038BD0FD5
MKTNNNIPAYRFQGYTDAWELRKLGELGTLKNGMNFSKDAMGIGFPFINLQNIFGKNIVDVSQLGLAKASSIQLKNYNLQKGDVLFVRSSVKLEGVGEAAIVPKNLENTTYSGFIIRYRDSFGLDYNFKRFTFGTSNIRNQIMSQATDSANKNISQQVLAELDILVPSLPEQETIGTFFSTLDRHITLHQRKLDTLKEQKKTYLKLLFPVKGQTKPALRFQGFEDDWEEVKLGEVCTIQGGNAWKSDSYSLTGEYLVVTIANVTGEYFIDDKKGNRIDINPNEMQYVLKKGDILISLTGNVGRVSKMTESKGVLNQRVGKLTTTANFEFIFSILRTEKFENEMRLASQGAAQANISNKDVLQYMIPLPSLPEQEAIGTFFQTLDQEIAQVEDKLASLKEMKKTLLRKLFV